MNDKKVLIGYCTVKKDTVMHNNQFQYAASFEDLTVPAGKYPVTAFKSDLDKTRDGKTCLGWRNYIEYKGTVIASNVGGKPGDRTWYCPMIYDYELAKYFLNGHNDELDFNEREEYELCPEWTLEVHDFVNLEGKRCFSMGVVMKEEANGSN